MKAIKINGLQLGEKHWTNGLRYKYGDTRGKIISVGNCIFVFP